jgi:hypothetical protein
VAHAIVSDRLCESGRCARCGAGEEDEEEEEEEEEGILSWKNINQRCVSCKDIAAKSLQDTQRECIFLFHFFNFFLIKEDKCRESVPVHFLAHIDELLPRFCEEFRWPLF